MSAETFRNIEEGAVNGAKAESATTVTKIATMVKGTVADLLKKRRLIERRGSRKGNSDQITTMDKKCTEPKMEFLLLTEISLSNAEGRAMDLTGELARHLEECDKCRACLPEWVKKVASWENGGPNHSQLRPSDEKAH